MSTEKEIFSMEDTRLLNLAQTIRERTILTLTKDNMIPDSTSDKELLTRCLDSMTGDVFKKTKIVTDKGIEDTQAQVAGSIAELLKRVTIQQNGVGIISEPSLDREIVVDNPVDGETFIGINSEMVKKEVLGE